MAALAAKGTNFVAVFSQESMDRFRAEAILKEHGPEMLALLKTIAAENEVRGFLDPRFAMRLHATISAAEAAR